VIFAEALLAGKESEFRGETRPTAHHDVPRKEGVIAAGLTALTILLFLGFGLSTLIVATS
jgi:hypothetical protein